MFPHRRALPVTIYLLALILLPTGNVSGLPAEFREELPLRLIEPPDGATVIPGETLLRWEPAGPGSLYHLHVWPRSTAGGPGKLRGGESALKFEVARNWIPLGRLNLDLSLSHEWFWTVNPAGDSLAPVSPRVFRVPSAGDDRLPIRKTGVRAGASEPRRGPVRFANGTLLREEEGIDFSKDEIGRHAVVRFAGPVRENWKSALRDRGVLIEAYLPHDALLVTIERGRPGDLIDSPGVSWIAPYRGEHKISGRLAARSKEHTSSIELVALLFSGEDEAAVGTRIRALGGEVRRSGAGILYISTSTGAIGQVAALDGIRWIEPYETARFENNDCQWVVQSDTSGARSLWNLGLTGDGVLLSMCDSGIRTSHQMHRDDLFPISSYGDYPLHRKVVGYWKADSTSSILFGDDAGASWHGTHTSCTALGNDSPFASSNDDGVAPDARLLFVDAGGTSNEVFLPVDLGDLFGAIYEGNGAGQPRILSNSWGSLQGGAYDFRCEQVDRFVWEHDDFLVLFSNGNGGSENTVGSPAASKNVISAGGTENGTSADQIYTSTSRGPTDDGRFKPTLCAPARLHSAAGESDNDFQTLDGTSMAAPAVAGAAALARQYFTDGWYPSGAPGGSSGFQPSAALLKAVLVASGADDVSGYPIPSHHAGWGRVRLRDALYFPGDTGRLAVMDERSGILTGEIFSYEISVLSSAEPLEVALVWNDYPSTPAAAINLVNDLNLKLTGGGGTYRGNVYTDGVSVEGGTADTLNVEELVLIEAPAPGTWTIEVEGLAVPFGPQPFALVVTGALDGGAATIALDKGSYGAADTILVRLEDADLPASTTVTVRSDTEPGGETLALTGSGGIYSGSIVTTSGLVTSDDGILAVSHGDSIEVSYADSSPAATVTGRAAAWLIGPIVMPCGMTGVNDIEGFVEWETDIPSDSRITYGLDPLSLSDTLYCPDLVQAHSIHLENMMADTTYFVRIESADHRGNRTIDDGGAEPYRLTTAGRSDVLLVVGDPTFERSDYYRNAFDRFDWTATTITGSVPAVGDRTHGMRSYPAVIWQVGWEQYPPFSEAARESIIRYVDGGGRLMVVSHDAAWALGDPSSSYWSVESEEWLRSALKIDFSDDPSYWNIAFGESGDPISGAYTSGILYTPFRSGGAGDEVSAATFSGTISTAWKSPPMWDVVGNRWTDPEPVGDADSAVWGGSPSRGVTCTFEWSQLNAAAGDDYTRGKVLDNSLKWLVERDHPNVTLTSFAGGGSITSAPVDISWTETTYAGVGNRKLEWSGDGGASWQRITDGAGSSPYSWDLAGVPNGLTVRIRVIVEDAGSPPLRGTAACTANIAVALTGNDSRGPKVIAGSATTSPNPVDVPGTALLTTLFSDSLRGGGNVTGAEWFLAPATPEGSGTPMSGTWGSLTVAAVDTIDAAILQPPLDTIWVRSVDGDGNWGEASPLPVILRGDFTGVASALPPRAFHLYANVPNPFNPSTKIRFDLPVRTRADLRIYSVNGRLVRQLGSGVESAGTHERIWDGRDNGGRQVPSGVYLLHLAAGEQQSVRKMVLIR